MRGTKAALRGADGGEKGGAGGSTEGGEGAREDGATVAGMQGHGAAAGGRVGCHSHQGR